jgi:hypothetical protein
MANEFRRLMKGAMAGDRAMMDTAAMAIGYYDATTQDHHRQTILDMGELAIEPFTLEGPYDFGTSDVLPRLRARGIELGLDRDFWQLPPSDAMLLQRKFGGLYMLAIRLKAGGSARACFKPGCVPHVWFPLNGNNILKR